MKGGPVYAWEPEKGVHIGIMPRNGSVKEMRWFKGDPAYVFHPMNAHTNGDVVTCDVCEFEQAPLFPWADGTPGDPDKATPRLDAMDVRSVAQHRRLQVGTARRHRLRIPAPRRTPHRHELPLRLFCVRQQIRSSVSAVSMASAASTTRPASSRFTTSVPAVRPTSRSSCRSPNRRGEGEGFLLANVYDANRKASHLVILDAENVTAGPAGDRLSRSSRAVRFPRQLVSGGMSSVQIGQTPRRSSRKSKPQAKKQCGARSPPFRATEPAGTPGAPDVGRHEPSGSRLRRRHRKPLQIAANPSVDVQFQVASPDFVHIMVRGNATLCADDATRAHAWNVIDYDLHGFFPGGPTDPNYVACQDHADARRAVADVRHRQQAHLAQLTRGIRQ